MPRDVEDTAIAAVSRPSVNRRPTEGGQGLAILRPGVMGLTVRRAPPFAPPPLLPSPGHHPTFRASRLRAVDRLSEGGCGGARTARNGVGGPLPIPPPRRALRRSDSDHAKCSCRINWTSSRATRMLCTGLPKPGSFCKTGFEKDQKFKTGFRVRFWNRCISCPDTTRLIVCSSNRRHSMSWLDHRLMAHRLGGPLFTNPS